MINSKLTKSSTRSLADAAKSIPTKAKTVRAKNSESPAPNLGAKSTAISTTAKAANKKNPLK